MTNVRKASARVWRASLSCHIAGSGMYKCEHVVLERAEQRTQLAAPHLLAVDDLVDGVPAVEVRQQPGGVCMSIGGYEGASLTGDALTRTDD